MGITFNINIFFIMKACIETKWRHQEEYCHYKHLFNHMAEIKGIDTHCTA